MDAIKLRHPYAPQSGEGQVYLPSSLPAALSAMDKDVLHFIDMNIEDYHPEGDELAIHATGLPDIPKLHNLVSEYSSKAEIILGGIVLENMDSKDVRALFPGVKVSGHDFPVPDATHASLIPFYEGISDENMKKYLENEFSLYVSNGCIYSCAHCGALRTQIDPLTGKSTFVKESYRDHSIVERDLSYLIERAQKLGLTSLNFYMSNLDVFQTPFVLRGFILSLARIKAKYPNFNLDIRGLTNVNTFLKFPDDELRQFVGLGLTVLGFGVDAGNERMQVAIRKKHTGGLRKTREAIERCLDFGVQPELLTIYGHPEDDNESIQSMLQFMTEMVETYQVTPRPHVYRVIPGNDEWGRNPSLAEAIVHDPSLAQAFDFTAEANSFTHPKLVDEINAAFRETCELSTGGSTQLLRAIHPSMSAVERHKVYEWNMGKYDK